MTLDPHDIAGGVRLTTQTFRVEFVSDISQLPGLAAKWESLNQGSDHDAPFFQSFAWNRHVASVRAANAPTRFKPLIATVWRRGELIGLWPLSLQLTAGAWIARSLDDPLGQFAGMAFAQGADIVRGAAAIMESLRTQADGIQIEAVIVGSPLHASLLRHGARAVAAQEAVFADLQAFSSFEEYGKTLNPKTRKNLRNLRNRLKRAHPIEHMVADTAETLTPLLLDTFDSRVEWLQRNGRTSPAFRMPGLREFIGCLPQVEGLRIVGFALCAGSTCMSSQWGFEYRGRFYSYMSAMEAGFEEFSPGRVHLGLVIEALFKRGIKAVELMPPAAPYKLAWSHRTKRIETMSLAFTAKGRLALDVAGWVMPRMRRLSRMLPESLRRSLVARLYRR